MKAQASDDTLKFPTEGEASSPMPKPLRLKTEAGRLASKKTPKKATVGGKDFSDFEDIRM